MSESEKDLFGESDQASSPAAEHSSPIAEPEPVHRNALLKRLAPSHAVEHAWTSRIPGFLNVEPLPFNAEKFGAQKLSDEELALNANTIRWTYAAAENEAEQKVTRISNARIVEWSDGSRTLQLGNEHFEIKTNTQVEPTFVCAQQESEPLLATRQVVWDTMTFLPSSTSSATHKMLAQALAKKQQSDQFRVGSVDTTEDPDKVQREIERVEQAKEKARRKLAAQRDDFVTYTDHSTSSQKAKPAPRSRARKPAKRNSSDEESDMDDMVDDGEEEESSARDSDSDEEEEAQSSGANDDDDDDDDERASRLNKIKSQNEPVQRRKMLSDDSD